MCLHLWGMGHMLFSFLVPCASFHLQPGKVPAGSGDPALPVVLLLAAHYKTLCRERSWPFRKLRGECHNKFWLVVCRIFWRPLEGDSPPSPFIFPSTVPCFPPAHNISRKSSPFPTLPQGSFQHWPHFLRIISPVYGQFSTISAKQSHDTSSSIPAQFCNSEFSTFFTDFPSVSTVEKLKTLFKDINLLHLQL